MATKEECALLTAVAYPELIIEDLMKLLQPPADPVA